MQYIKFIIAGCVLAVALCGCGRQVKLLTSETQTETQMMDDAGGEETVVSSAEAFATTTTEAETPEQEQSDDVAVYVCGAVRQPGVYMLQVLQSERQRFKWQVDLRTMRMLPM